ncbi:MAG: methionine--tRNA ligase [Candidatus Nanopelagicales bacterium]|nr:methionine--tRNA ligase [Candidatus Nanopelagicales bacterium]
MSSVAKSFYVTTPIYYVNDAPHIGHAYTSTAADVLTRWHRQRGESVWFLTGVDEHGTKVQRAAEQGGVTPQEWVDALVRDSWKPVLKTIDAQNDDFIRTTQERHIARVRKFWDTVKDNGYVFSDSYEGPYCVGCEEFKFPADLIPGTSEWEGQQVCDVHGRPPEELSEDNWFFKLSEFTQPLIDRYEADPNAIRPESAYNEVMSFLRGGLVDISMSRSSVEWGIPLSWDESQVVYVWFDALLNYITAVGYGAEPGSSETKLFERVWPASVQLVGKDILRFHAVYWPAMLMAAGLQPPKQVFAHGWLLVGGEKMSKTKLTGIAPELIIDHFGSDGFRYYFMAAIAFGNDGSFSWEDMSARYTSELANGLGNLASRATAMVGKYFEGSLPAVGPISDAENTIHALLTETVTKADACIGELDFAGAIGHVRAFIEHINGYVTEQEPWVLAKSEETQGALATVLYTVCESLRAISILYNPVMPKAMAELWKNIGALEALGDLADQGITSVGTWGQLPAGVQVVKGPSLFPRLEDPENI